MKQKIHHLYYLFRKFLDKNFANLFRKTRFAILANLFSPQVWIIILLMCSNLYLIAQEQPPPDEFPVGSTFGSGNRTTQALYDSYAETGMNMMEQYANESTRPYIGDYNLNVVNMDSEQDLIIHYSSAYYSKWQAEEDQDTPYVGVKHKYGSYANYIINGESIPCWSSIGMTSPGDSLLFGPHYHQEKWYRRWLYADADPSKMDGIYDVRYIPRFRMALAIADTTIGLNEDVCRLYVMVRHGREINGVGDIVRDDTLKSPITLKVSDFPANGQFDYFYLGDIPSQRWYRYPEEYQSPGEYNKLRTKGEQGIPGTVWVDIYGNNGVEFRVEWLRSDAKCRLFVDYVEVYDDYGWRDYIEQPELTAYKITSYADSFKTMGWTNIMHWVGVDEPFTIDSYIPIRTVDSLLSDIGAPPLLVHVYPYWNVEINKDSQLVRYYKTAKPDPLNIHFFPFLSWFPTARYEDWEAFRNLLQISYTLTKEKGFWYKAQNFGTQLPNGEWSVWRQPDSSEHKAEIMLALAHGVKGLTFSHYDSYPQEGYTLQGFIKDDPPTYTKTDLWYLARDNIVPRLKGTLGRTLMNLNYTGDYINLYYKTPTDDPLPQSSTHDYLTVGSGGMPAEDMFWHFGFFDRPSYPEDKYFFLTNLMQWSDSNQIRVQVTPPSPGFSNYRFRNVEGYFDTTFTESIEYWLNLRKGEGYLYEVAPVVLFGGRLIYPELVSEQQVLADDMIIENGATLTVYNNYFADGNIIVKNGSIVNGENGRIQFANGKKLIIQGSATICGTVNQKLILDFISKDYENGITIREGGSLNISYCKIKNASVGITSELNANYFNIHHVDFEDCGTHSINIFGRGIGQLLTPPSQIKFCSITNSVTGISAANMSEIIIQKNFITNTERGILLSQVTNSVLVENIIQSNLESMEGIFASSIGGVIRGNYISGHTVGIHLGNSSPDIGANTVTYCKTHAMYLGTGSNPNMVGRFAKDASRIYPISGYNNFINNGGYEGEGDDNDGSEIYFNESNAIMREGCNSIVDDREPDGELRNTLLLMNCPREGSQIEIRAEYNYWGETRICDERFGNLTVYFDPYYTTACPLPDQQFDDEALITKTSSGEVIDTLFPATEDYYSLSGIEALYALAGESFVTGDLESAENYYNQITSSDTTLTVMKEAYSRKYEIGKILNRDASYFSELRNLYSSLSGSTSDSLLKKIFNQLASLCLTAQEEYVPALNEFDEIIQQNPNTEAAVYAEIDALTTALLVEGEDSTLQKGRLGKYLIKTSGDYNQRVDEILRNNFGSKAKETEEELLPTEYTLYQNYPNPFNPVTTIKYDLPFASEVSLIIYDILGRKVKALVNAKQQPGRYEVQFDASNLASGVYIYQLIADKFINSKKMILLK